MRRNPWGAVSARFQRHFWKRPLPERAVARCVQEQHREQLGPGYRVERFLFAFLDFGGEIIKLSF